MGVSLGDVGWVTILRGWIWRDWGFWKGGEEGGGASCDDGEMLGVWGD